METVYLICPRSDVPQVAFSSLSEAEAYAAFLNAAQTTQYSAVALPVSESANALIRTRALAKLLPAERKALGL